MLKRKFSLLTAAVLAGFILSGCCNCNRKQKTETASVKQLFSLYAGGGTASGFLTSSNNWAQYKTLVHVNYDQEKITFRYECPLNPKEKIVIKGSRPDEMAIFSGENVELFLCPDPKTGVYYQFAVNPAGAMYSAKGMDFSWEPKGLKITNDLKKDRWTMKIVIPYQTLGIQPPKQGDVWTGNFCRCHTANGGAIRESSNWAGLHSYHDRALYEKIVFEKKSSQAIVMLEDFDNRDGILKGTFSFSNIREPVSIEMICGDFRHEEKYLPKQNGTFQVSARVPAGYIPLKNLEPVHITARSAANGAVIFAKKISMSRITPDALLLDQYYYTAKHSKIAFQFLHNEKAKEFCRVSLLKDGKTVRSGLFHKQGSFDLKGLEEGRYVLETFIAGYRSSRVLYYKKDGYTVKGLEKGAKLELKDGAVFSNGKPVFLLGTSTTGKPLPAGTFFNLHAGNFGVAANPAWMAGALPGRRVTYKPEVGYLYPEKKQFMKMVDACMAKKNPNAAMLNRLTYEAQIKTFFPEQGGKLKEVDSAKFHKEMYEYLKKKYPQFLYCLQTDFAGAVKDFLPACDLMEVCPSGGYTNAIISRVSQSIPNVVSTLKGKPVIFWFGVTIPNKCRTAEEVRACVFLDIIYGGSGAIFHMGHGRLPQERSRVWSVVKNICGEVQTFYPQFRSMPLADIRKIMKINGDKFVCAVRSDGKKAIALIVSLSASENHLKLVPANGWKLVSGGPADSMWTPYEARVCELTK